MEGEWHSHKQSAQTPCNTYKTVCQSDYESNFNMAAIHGSALQNKWLFCVWLQSQIEKHFNIVYQLIRKHTFRSTWFLIVNLTVGCVMLTLVTCFLFGVPSGLGFARSSLRPKTQFKKKYFDRLLLSKIAQNGKS